jgi:hypothetical protein
VRPAFCHRRCASGADADDAGIERAFIQQPIPLISTPFLTGTKITPLDAMSGYSFTAPVWEDGKWVVPAISEVRVPAGRTDRMRCG